MPQLGEVEEVVDRVDVVPQRRQVAGDGVARRRRMGAPRSRVRTAGSNSLGRSGVRRGAGAVVVGDEPRRVRPHLGQRLGEVVGSQRRQVGADGHEHAVVGRGRGAQASVQVAGVGRHETAPASGLHGHLGIGGDHHAS